MRRWFYLNVMLPLRHFLIGDVMAELAAIKTQLQTMDDVAAMARHVEQALVTLAVHADEAKKPQPSSSILQRPSA